MTSPASPPDSKGTQLAPKGLKVLLAEDEPLIAETLGDSLEEAGFQVLKAVDTDSALAILRDQDPDVVLTDIRMPGAGGMEILRASVESDKLRPVIVITGFATVDNAVEAMRLGAINYIQKPFSNDSVVQMVRGSSRVRALEAENKSLREQLRVQTSCGSMVGASTAMTTVFDRIRTVAVTDATILIEGESGTGKERVALALHEASARSQGPFIAISCAALPESLLEAELFGHERGAFTDAHKEKRGRFELASGGTLFLDDIDDMPMPVQVKLLRVLQERNFERLGGETTVDIDIRVIAATKAPLRQLVRDGKFREDLFYRIHVVPVDLPPLRDRGGDVSLLARHLVEKHGGDREYTFSEATQAALEKYPWPGNVRELENAVQRAIALAGKAKELKREHLLPLDSRWRGATEPSDEVRPLREVIKAAEALHLERALESTGGHRTQTAELLGISRKVLWEKLREHGITSEDEG
ncbi:MAG: sigma-54 dependent transcriptional regulator [Planctomycetota bacterium]|nr:sigma-54 dependent transcriptional regulator [Planctomycetota bacterium]MDG2144433.1 sigma-54 dependent transcriptional regulator [Planctomycetota bacterium]